MTLALSLNTPQAMPRWRPRPVACRGPPRRVRSGYPSTAFCDSACVKSLPACDLLPDAFSKSTTQDGHGGQIHVGQELQSRGRD